MSASNSESRYVIFLQMPKTFHEGQAVRNFLTKVVAGQISVWTNSWVIQN